MQLAAALGEISVLEIFAAHLAHDPSFVPPCQMPPEGSRKRNSRSRQSSSVSSLFNCSILGTIVDEESATLLHYAAANKQGATVKWLVKQGLDRHQPDDNGYLPQQYAAMNEDQQLAKWLTSDMVSCLRLCFIILCPFYQLLTNSLHSTTFSVKNFIKM